MAFRAIAVAQVNRTHFQFDRFTRAERLFHKSQILVSVVNHIFVRYFRGKIGLQRIGAVLFFTSSVEPM
jgi:hypothetical protein